MLLSSYSIRYYMNATLPLPSLETQVETPLAEISSHLEKVSAEERVRWGLERFGSETIL
jgi:hypothetical protein